MQIFDDGRKIKISNVITKAAQLQLFPIYSVDFYTHWLQFVTKIGKKVIFIPFTKKPYNTKLHCRKNAYFDE